MITSKSGIGRLNEDLAAGYLESRGYRIVRRNYRTRFAEIDIVALDGATLCFVEVRGKSALDPAESVDLRKRRRISLAAVQYLKENGGMDRKARFDVVCVSGRGDKPELRLIADAFELTGDF